MASSSESGKGQYEMNEIVRLHGDDEIADVPLRKLDVADERQRVGEYLCDVKQISPYRIAWGCRKDEILRCYCV